MGNVTSISVSPPALVMSPPKTPDPALLGSCLRMMVIVPDTASPVLRVLLNPIGSPLTS